MPLAIDSPKDSIRILLPMDSPKMSFQEIENKKQNFLLNMQAFNKKVFQEINPNLINRSKVVDEGMPDIPEEDFKLKESLIVKKSLNDGPASKRANWNPPKDIIDEESDDLIHIED